MFFFKNEKGFSILELLIVIAIASILAVVARPSIKSLIEGFRLRSAANTVKHQLIYAKTRALGDPNVHAGVFLNTVAPYSSVAFLDDDADTMNDYIYIEGNDHILIPTYLFPKTNTLTILSGTNPVVFRGDGSAKASITFSITNTSGKSYTISVLASTGRIKVTRD